MVWAGQQLVAPVIPTLDLSPQGSQKRRRVRLWGDKGGMAPSPSCPAAVSRGHEWGSCWTQSSGLNCRCLSPWTCGGLPWGLLPPPLCPVSALCLSWQPGATAVTAHSGFTQCCSPGSQEGRLLQAGGEGGTLRCREPRGLLAACGRQMGTGLSLQMENPARHRCSGVPAALPAVPRPRPWGDNRCLPSPGQLQVTPLLSGAALLLLSCLPLSLPVEVGVLSCPSVTAPSREQVGARAGASST